MGPQLLPADATTSNGCPPPSYSMLRPRLTTESDSGSQALSDITPFASDHLIAIRRPWLQELEPDEFSFEWIFDRWEYLLGLVMVDLRR